jgi:hypothetical protein
MLCFAALLLMLFTGFPCRSTARFAHGRFPSLDKPIDSGESTIICPSMPHFCATNFFSITSSYLLSLRLWERASELVLELESGNFRAMNRPSNPAFAEAYNSGNIERLIELYEADAVLAPPSAMCCAP